jgi:hypothetical protein
MPLCIPGEVLKRQPISVLALPEAELPGYMRVSLGTAQPAALLL